LKKVSVDGKEGPKPSTDQPLSNERREILGSVRVLGISRNVSVEEILSNKNAMSCLVPE
jgi:hypothetical protein